MTYTEHAWAKLNLTLDILGKRPDGYHEMRMVMQSIDLRDTVTLREETAPGIRVASSCRFLPCDETNIAAKAILRFFEATGLPCPGFSVRLDKEIPVCAGMAGGSSDGAAVLRLLRREYCPALPQEALEAIAARVGSDVPYCVRGGTALAEGRGEILTDLPPLPRCWLVLCKPDFGIPTPELFARADAQTVHCRPDIAGMRRALEQGDLEGVAARLCNGFEELLPPEYHAVFRIRDRLRALGALNASMSGSGPTVFGIFRERDAAERAAASLGREYAQTYLTEPVGRLEPRG